MRKNYFLRNLFILSLLLVVTVCNAQFRAIRIGGARLSETPSENQAIVNKLTASYVNTVFLWVQSDAGSKTSSIKVTDFITKAHAADIKVYPIITIMTDQDYLNSNPAARVYHCPKPSVNLRPYLMGSGSNYPNLLHPGYKQNILDDVGYIINTYDFDGIMLDKPRYTHHVYSFDKWHTNKAADLGCDTVELFKYYTTDANYTKYVAKNEISDVYHNKTNNNVVIWFDMRKQVLSEYFQAIRDTINKVKPNMPLCALFMDEVISSPTGVAPVHYAQDYALHAQYFDVLGPQIQKTASVKTITAGAANLIGDRTIVLSEITATGDASVMASNIKDAVENGSYGVIVSNYRTISSDEWKAIGTEFEKIALSSSTNNLKFDENEINILEQNYPNPVKSTTEITFRLTKNAQISLNVYDISGRIVAPILIDNKMDTGTHKINFDVKDLSNGIYFYKLDVDGKSITRKMIVRK